MADQGTINFSDEAENEYASAVAVGHKVDPRAQKIFIACVVLVVLYVVGLIIPKDILNASLHQGGYNAGYSLSWFIQDLGENVNGLVATLTGQDTGPVQFSTTMVRYIIIALAGAGLALCGAVYQGSFRNALVSPSTLGVMSGGTMGMMLWVVFCVDEDGGNVAWLTGAGTQSVAAVDSWEYLWSSYSLAILSFVCCLAVVALVLLVLRLAGRGSTNPILLIITGQIMGGIMGAIANTIRYYYVSQDPFGVAAGILTDLQIASFYRLFTWVDLVAVGIPLVAVFALVMALRRRMGLLAFGAEEARSLGVDARRMQILLVGACTLLTAIIISFCGTVGFVGFLVPHLARRLVGPDFSYLLPAATVLGATFVLAAYLLVACTLGPAYETMVGMYISIGGAVVFLVTALRGKGGVRGEFR